MDDDVLFESIADLHVIRLRRSGVDDNYLLSVGYGPKDERFTNIVAMDRATLARLWSAMTKELTKDLPRE